MQEEIDMQIADGSITLSKQIEEVAIKLAALDIIRQLCREGKITKEELHHIEKNHRDILE